MSCTTDKLSKNTHSYLHNTLLTLTLCSLFSPSISNASTNLSGGVWFNYNQNLTSGAQNSNGGNIGDEALVLYADGKAKPGEGNWSYSAEWRMGPGSFTDPKHNSTGDQSTLHKAWIGFNLNKNNILRIGKSQVPFGWKTYNFWPGDMLLGAYGDEMDVGAKLSGTKSKWHYDVAYFHQDDWGSTSTDTTDDNGHWGSTAGGASQYRKVQTFVGNAGYEFLPGQTFGVSLQSGKLQDLLATNKPLSGDHYAGVVYYKGKFDKAFVNAQILDTHRNLPTGFATTNGLERKTATNRYALELGQSHNKWTYYIDANWAKSKTSGVNHDMVAAYAPGIKYKYGPGWIYAEYLTQNGYITMNGDVRKGDFSAVYLTMDYYF
ncbi:porin [Hydrogenovibrio kuenenii]|uniref:porin n=1 Tax=Hydrogenovibrio kuenenii TaxID=63658 RepID=UPI0004AF0A65|nr:hypothetical protein [Hydrogenovibrio kuenenii]